MNTQVDPQDLAIFSDLHKDVYGVRPRGAVFTDQAELDRAMADLIGQLQAQHDAEDAHARAAGFASRSVWMTHWMDQESAALVVEAYGPQRDVCLIPADHWDRPIPELRGRLDDPAPASTCLHARTQADRWYAGEL